MDQFLAIPDFDERRLELIDGEVYEKPMPRWGRGRLALVLGALLNQHGFAATEARAMIPPSADLGASSPPPDLAFYVSQPPASSDWMTRPPDLVVEILSPGQSRREMRARIDAYQAFGVHSIWIIDWERRSADIYEDGERRTTDESDMLASGHVPGFHARLGDVFRQGGVGDWPGRVPIITSVTSRSSKPLPLSRPASRDRRAVTNSFSRSPKSGGAA